MHFNSRSLLMSFHYWNSALPRPALQTPVASIPFPKHVAQELGWLWFHTSKNDTDTEGIFRSREVLPFSRKPSTPPSKYLAPYLHHLIASFTAKMKIKSCFFQISTGKQVFILNIWVPGALFFFFSNKKTYYCSLTLSFCVCPCVH